MTPAEQKDYELSLIGAPVSSEDKLKAFKKSEKKKARFAEKANETITIYHTFVPDQNTAGSPKEDLKQLAEEYDNGFLQDQITKRQKKLHGEWRENLDKWQKETEKIARVSNKKSYAIEPFEVDEGEGGEKTYSNESSLTNLLQLQEQNDCANALLNQAEEKTLKRWINEKRRQIPVFAPLRNGQQMTCSPDDDLEFLEKTARLSKELLPEAEYKRLGFWHFQKRMNRNINRTIEIKSPLGKLVYSRQDVLEYLQVVAEKHRSGEKWVNEQVSKDEYERLYG